MKIGRSSMGKTALGAVVFFVMLLVDAILTNPILGARLPEWLTFLNGGIIFFALVGAGYLLSWARTRLTPANCAIGAAFAGTALGVLFAQHYLSILSAAAVTAFPAWAGSEIAVYSPQDDAAEKGE